MQNHRFTTQLFAWLPQAGRVMASLVIMLGMGLVVAQAQVPEAPELEQAEAAIAEIEASLERAFLLDEEIADGLRSGTNLRLQSTQCIANIKTEVERINALVGKAAEDEETTEKAPEPQGTDTSNRLEELQKHLLLCQDFALRADTIVSQMKALEDRRQASKFSSRGRDVVSVLSALFDDEENWHPTFLPIQYLFKVDHSPSGLEILIIVMLTIIGFATGRWLIGKYDGVAEEAPFVLAALGLLLGLTFVFGRHDVHLLVIGWHLLAIFCLMSLSVYLPRPATEKGVERTGLRIGGFLLASLVGHHLNLAFSNSLGTEQIEFLRLGVFIAIFVTAFPATRHIRFVVLFERIWKPLRALFILGFGLALFAELTGYRALASYLLGGFTSTLIAIIIYSLVTRGGTAIFQSLTIGNTQWAVRAKRALRLEPRDPIPGMMWLNIVIELFIFIGFSLAVLTAWGLSDASRDTMINYAINGFEVWGITLVPGRLIGGILIFSVLLMVSRRIRGVAERRWTDDLDIEPGGRDALVTLIGYGGVIIAVLVGLSWAGFSFDKLALVAGALSVGIGFGLQNVISNFVSGLILLFEQPIRVGDWVMVGQTEGIVKKIRVRATEIQTFDHTEVIVPNAELISGPVTNYTLRSKLGRIFLPVGVGYGSDTTLVRDLLLGIVNAHPKILRGGKRAPEPSVYFTLLGDSALTFEIRAHIANVSDRLSVVSDLHFAIFKTFAEHKIEIPFPQSDIHIRDLPEIVSASQPEK